MYQRKNFAYGTVLTPPSPAASGTSIVLNSGHGARFPNTSGGTYVCVVKQVSVPCTPENSEVVLVTTHDPAGDTFTVTREQESSSARTILVGDEFYLAPTDGVWDQIDVLTTKGDLLSQSAAGTYARLGIGTNDYALVAASGETTGMKWENPATLVGSSIHGADAKTTMADADKMAIIDTEASNVLKTLSWAYVKSILKTYFDGFYPISSIFRQALINGNFDVWQRGTSVAMTTANAYAADRWYCETATAGTDKTVSRQDGTGVNGSYYCARVAMVQDVDELLTFSQALESQDSIKFRGQKVTLSFYARGGAEFVADNATLVSKIVTGKGTDQKVLAFTTSADGVSQNNTLTTSWQKFTCTTTAAIASDITQIGVSFAFTHAGSGTTTNYFEVTQVQLCAGDVALPFMPKSFEDELRACQRYYEKSFPYATAPAEGTAAIQQGGTVWATTNIDVAIYFRDKKRISVTPVIYASADAGSGSQIALFSGSWSAITSGTTDTSENSFVVRGTTTGLTVGDSKPISFNWTADAEL